MPVLWVSWECGEGPAAAAVQLVPRPPVSYQGPLLAGFLRGRQGHVCVGQGHRAECRPRGLMLGRGLDARTLAQISSSSVSRLSPRVLVWKGC